MDTFVEQIIKRKKQPKDVLIIVGILLAAVIVAAVVVLLCLTVPFLTLFIPILLFGIGYLTWWLLTNQNVEYEYSITNGDIDIDRIVARRKRKRVVSVSGQKIEAVGVYNPAEWANRAVDRRVSAAPCDTDEGVRYFTYHSKKRGHTLVIFAPDDRVSAAFEGILPRLQQRDWNR